VSIAAPVFGGAMEELHQTVNDKSTPNGESSEIFSLLVFLAPETGGLSPGGAEEHQHN
jgi:hypothetical protein